MRRHDIVSRTLLILTVITFALAAPVLVQEKRQACADEVHVPRDVITVLGKRAAGDDLHMLWDGPWQFGNVLGKEEEPVPEMHAPPPNLAGVPEVHAPPPNLAEEHVPEVSMPDLAEEHVAEVHASPPNQAGVRVQGVDVLMDDPWHFMNVFRGAEVHGADAKSGHLLSPMGLQGSTKSEEDWFMDPGYDADEDSDGWSRTSEPILEQIGSRL